MRQTHRNNVPLSSPSNLQNTTFKMTVLSSQEMHRKIAFSHKTDLMAYEQAISSV